MKLRLHARAADPARFNDATLIGTRSLHPMQRGRTLFSIVGVENEIPQPQNGNRPDNVDQQKTTHNASSDAHGTSEVATEARDNRLLLSERNGASCLWKLRSEIGGIARKNAHRPLCQRSCTRSANFPSCLYNGCVPSRNKAFRIREFTPADFEILWRIDQTCFPAGISYSRPELRSYIQHRQSFTLVAEDARENSPEAETDPGEDDTNSGDGAAACAKPRHNLRSRPVHTAIAGFIVAEASRQKGHIITIDVVAPARRFGVGSLLLESAERRLKVDGCRVVELETAVDNISALSFYKRHHYHVIGTAPRYYSNGVDALVLEKELAADSR